MPKEHTQLKARNRTETLEPHQYNVIIENDDFTTMDFVVKVLMEVFFYERVKAEHLMLKVHHTGNAVVGTYTYDVATSKVRKVTEMARAEGFPLRLRVEQA